LGDPRNLQLTLSSQLWKTGSPARRNESTIGSGINRELRREVLRNCGSIRRLVKPNIVTRKETMPRLSRRKSVLELLDTDIHAQTILDAIFESDDENV